MIASQNVRLLHAIFQILIITLFVLRTTMADSIPCGDNEAPTTQTYKLLIITPEEFKDALTELKSFKDNTFRPTLLVTLEEIYATSDGRDSAEQVKKYIAQCKQTHGIYYVMLVGDSDKFPVRYHYIKDINTDANGVVGWRYIATDWYYSDLFYEGTWDFCDWDSNENGFFGEILVQYPNPSQPGRNIALDHLDYKPDVGVGRIPASTIEEVTTYANKIIQYESTCPQNMANWFNKFLSVSGIGNQMWNSADEITHLNNISGQMSSIGFHSIKLYDSDYCANYNIVYDDEPTNENITLYLNEGVGFMNIHCHGHRNNWCGEYFIDPTAPTPIDHMSGLNNSGKLPIIFAMPCFSGAFAPIPGREDADLGEPYIDKDGNRVHLTSDQLPDGANPIPMENWTELPQINPLQQQNTDPDYFPEYFLVKNVKGGIAYIGNTSIGYGPAMSINRGFFDGYVNGGHRTLGDLFNYAMDYAYDEHYDEAYSPGGLLGGHHTGLLRVILFGDPSLAVGGLDTLPEIDIESPFSGQALQDGVTFAASTFDRCGDVTEVYFYLREPNGVNGTPIGYENLVASFNSYTGLWEYDFNTISLPDGHYIIIAKAIDDCGNEGWSQATVFSICNWAVIELLPATLNSKAKRTIPVKFSFRVAQNVDVSAPFVYNKYLEIRIFATTEPENSLQSSFFGDKSSDYRIDVVSEHYITNFKTLNMPNKYVVEILRTTNNFLVGKFTFETVK